MQITQHPGLPGEEIVEGWFVHHDGLVTRHTAAHEVGKGYVTFYLFAGSQDAKFGWLAMDFFPASEPDAEEQAYRAARDYAFAHVIATQKRLRDIDAKLKSFEEQKANG